MLKMNGNPQLKKEAKEGASELFIDYLTIRLRARVFYEQIVNEAQPS